MIDIIVLLALGFAIGYKVSEIIHLLSFRRIMRDLNISEQQLLKVARDQGITVQDDRSEEDRELGIRETIHIKIEQHGGQIYAYKSDTDEFLGQGTDPDDLVNGIARRFKGIRMIVDEGADLLQKSHG
jgi:hypothetical protein